MARREGEGDETGGDKKTPDHELIFKQEGICQDRPRPSLIHILGYRDKFI